jgi:hypothetical protein
MFSLTDTTGQLLYRKYLNDGHHPLIINPDHTNGNQKKTTQTCRED